MNHCVWLCEISVQKDHKHDCKFLTQRFLFVRNYSLTKNANLEVKSGKYYVVEICASRC
jgi:hypothetical protein